jgi:hypothetical protein
MAAIVMPADRLASRKGRGQKHGGADVSIAGATSPVAGPACQLGQTVVLRTRRVFFLNP